MQLADRVKDTTASTGAGAVTLAAAPPTGYRSFAAAFATGTTGIPYCIAGGAEWEIGLGTLTSATTLTRDTVLASSSGGAAVSFSAGTKDVFCTAAARALAGGTLPASFSAAIPFTASCQMATQTVTGAIAFTVDSVGAIDGVQVNVDLIANGTNVPTFTGFREWGGSSGYINAAGVRNCITFFRRDGIAYCSIAQQLGAAPEPSAPGAVTSFAAGAGTSSSQTLTFGQPLTGSTPVTFTVQHKLSSGSIWTTDSTNATSGITISGLAASTAYDYRIYATNSLGDGPTSTLTNVSTSASGAQVLRMVSGLNVTESGSAGAGWNYTGTGSSFANHGGALDKGWQSGVDGEVYFTINHAPGSVNVVLGAGSAGDTVFTAPFAVWVNAAGTLYRCTSGTFTDTGVSWANGNKVGLQRVGSSINLRKFDGAAWSTVYTWTGAGTGAAAAVINFGNAGATAFDVRGNGLA